MFELVLRLLSSGLSLWDNKEKNKYTDKLLEIERAYYAEQNKPEFAGDIRTINNPEDYRSNAVLDNLEFELRILSKAFTSSVNRK